VLECGQIIFPTHRFTTAHVAPGGIGKACLKRTISLSLGCRLAAPEPKGKHKITLFPSRKAPGQHHMARLGPSSGKGPVHDAIVGQVGIAVRDAHETCRGFVESGIDTQGQVGRALMGSKQAW